VGGNKCDVFVLHPRKCGYSMGGCVLACAICIWHRQGYMVVYLDVCVYLCSGLFFALRLNFFLG